MKRILALSLVLCCLASSASALSSDRSDYVGTWVMAQPTSSGGAICEMFRLTGDGKVFYMNEYFDSDAPSFGRQTVDVWRQTADGIHIYYGEIAETDAFLLDGFLMIPGPGGYIPYGKVPEYSETSGPDIASKIPDDCLSILLPIGQYTVGVNLPSGEYSVKANTKEINVGFFSYDADGSFLWSYSIGNDEILEHISLSDGYTVDVMRGTAILLPVSVSTESYSLPSGSYIVSRELPSGVYTITAETDDTPVHFVAYDGDKKETVLDINLSNGESYESPAFSDGLAIFVFNGRVILDPLPKDP